MTVKLLWDAIKKKDIPRITELLAEGVDINGVAYGYEILNLAIATREVELVELVLKYGADINAVTQINGISTKPLLGHLACLGGEDIVKYLLKYGADIKAVDELGRTPLCFIMYLETSDRDSIIRAATEFDNLYNLFSSGNLDAFYQAPLSSLSTRWAVYTKYYKSIGKELSSLASFEAFLNKDIKGKGICNGLVFSNILDLMNEDFINKEITIHNPDNADTWISYQALQSTPPNDCPGEEERKEDMPLLAEMTIDGNIEG